MTASGKSQNPAGRTRTFTFGEASPGLSLECGRAFGPVSLAYETWGKLNENRDNAVLVCHAFSGNSHVSSCDDPDGSSPGWWDGLVGPGKAVDTDRYFVICSNVLGGCSGSTGPASRNPGTGRPYGLDFPVVTIRDMVEAQSRLLDHLGVAKVLSVIGGSMGGMQALQWAASFPDRARSVIPIATTLKHSPQQIALDEVGRQAVMADPDWNRGNYYGGRPPEKGLALARMIGHITYMSDRSMEDKFSRKLKDGKISFSFATDFEVEGYLRYRGDSFVRRFDANSYLYITKAMDYFDLSGDRLFGGGGPSRIRFLVIGFHSDWLYPLHQSREIVRLLKTHGADATACEIRSEYGHDAFLLEIEEESRLVRHFLAKTQDLADREDE